VRQRRMLERLANIDGLTELANRRRFDEIYEHEWQRACQSGRPLSLALLDIDAFKQFNDRYGHPAGDRALRSVARTTGAAMHRPGDLAARYGGEELLLLLPETDAQSAHAIAEALRAAIAGLAIPHEASSVAPVLTVSIGGATFDPAGNEQPFELFEAADAQLYRAKQAGRDQVWWRALALVAASA
jgi:diguanylate cyclase (GGDEF)-like protein